MVWALAAIHITRDRECSFGLDQVIIFSHMDPVSIRISSLWCTVSLSDTKSLIKCSLNLT